MPINSRSAVRVEGLTELRKALGQIGGPVLQKNLRKRFKQVGDEVAADIRPTIPARSGRTRATVKAGVSGNKGYVQAGGPRAPWFGWLDYGGTLKPTGQRRNTITRERKPEGRYVQPGVRRNKARITDGARQALDDTARELGLKQ